MKIVKMPLDEFIKQLQKIQAEMSTVKRHPYTNTISFYLHCNDDEDSDIFSGSLALCEDSYDPAIERDYHMGCQCTLGAVINLIKDPE